LHKIPGVNSAEIKVGVGDGETDCVGVGLVIATPLFHTKVLPDLMHVNFLPWAVFVSPLVEHLAPALTAAKAGTEKEEITNDNAISKASGFLMEEILL
jgi:hypothetical protein